MDQLYLTFSSLAAFGGTTPSARLGTSGDIWCHGQGCVSSRWRLPSQPAIGRKVVLRFFLIYFIQFSRQGLGLQNDEIHGGDVEDSCSHVQLGVRVGPARGPSVPLASCPWPSPSWPSPEAPEAARARPAGLVPSLSGGGMRQPQPRGPRWGLGRGFNPGEGAVEILLCIWGRGGFILEKKAPPSLPFFPLGCLTLMASPVALDLYTSFTLPSAPAPARRSCVLRTRAALWRFFFYIQL